MICSGRTLPVVYKVAWCRPLSTCKAQIVRHVFYRFHLLESPDFVFHFAFGLPLPLLNSMTRAIGYTQLIRLTHTHPPNSNTLPSIHSLFPSRPFLFLFSLLSRWYCFKHFRFFYRIFFAIFFFFTIFFSPFFVNLFG